MIFFSNTHKVEYYYWQVRSHNAEYKKFEKLKIRKAECDKMSKNYFAAIHQTNSTSCRIRHFVAFGFRFFGILHCNSEVRSPN